MESHDDRSGYFTIVLNGAHLDFRVAQHEAPVIVEDAAVAGVAGAEGRHMVGVRVLLVSEEVLEVRGFNGAQAHVSSGC